MIGGQDLLDLADRGVAIARARGADQAEVFAESARAVDVELQKGDIHTASTADEISIGIRVVRGGSIGFATVNGRDRLERACEDAIAMAAASPPDPGNGLGEPAPIVPLDTRPDPAIAELTVERLVELAAGVLEGVRSRDVRVRIDSGGVSAAVSSRAIATSTGIRHSEEHSGAQGYLFGMAVDGDDVGSFDAQGQAVLRAADLGGALDRVVERFVERCTGALGARSGETYRGPVVLAPEVVSSFVLADLLFDPDRSRGPHGALPARRQGRRSRRGSIAHGRRRCSARDRHGECGLRPRGHADGPDAAPHRWRAPWLSL